MTPNRPQRLAWIFFALGLAFPMAGGCVHESLHCAVDDDCDLDCSGGDCTLVCDEGSECDADCSGGDCTINCGEGAECDADCSGGDCSLTCERGSTCDLSCSGGDCQVLCHAEADCDLSCSGGDCSLDTFGQRDRGPEGLSQTCVDLCDALSKRGEEDVDCIINALGAKGFSLGEQDRCGDLGDEALCGECFVALGVDARSCAVSRSSCAAPE